jgi:hypothetical protein
VCGNSKVTGTHSEYAIQHFLLSYGKNGYAKTLQYLVIPSLPVFLHNFVDIFRFCINRANVTLSTNFYTYIKKVVQIWPGLVRLVYTQISPGHIWTTFYLFIYLWDLHLHGRKIVWLLCEVQAADMVGLCNGVKLFLKTQEPRRMKNLIIWT